MVDSLESKMKSPKRTILLEPIEGLATKNTIGMTDSSLFTGSNKLFAVMDPQTTLWSFQYERGVLPQPLKDKYTKFSVLLKHAEDYFGRRNIRIKEVKD